MENVCTRIEHQTSPERSRVWSEPAALVTRRKRVSVVYYLSRNGHLEHPHFMEVPLSCPDGLYLKEDVMSRLNLLRGKGLACMYSWSSKRSYKNGFVWHDLSKDDYIHPVHGLDYVLKGSEIQERGKSVEDSSSSLIMSSTKNQHWSSSNLLERKVYKTESARETGEAENEKQIVEVAEGSPPPLDSSPETLESLMKADKRVTVETSNTKMNSNEEDIQSGTLKASSVLMQLITCGSFSFRHSGTPPNGVKLISNQHKAEESSQLENKEVEDGLPSLGDKEYFSGSSSDNADRERQSELELAEMHGVESVSVMRAK